MSGSALDALLGRLFSEGIEQELRGGLGFSGGLKLTPSADRHEVTIDPDAIPPGPPGPGTQIKTRHSALLPQRTALQLLGVAAFDATTQTVGDFDRADLREFGANPGGYFATTATAAGGSPNPTLNAASSFVTGNWAMWHQAGAAHGLATPGAPVLAVQGTAGSSTISVKVVAVTSTHGYTAAGAATTITNANATLSAADFVECWGNVTGVAGAYKYLFFVQFGGSGSYSYVGASIANPQFDEDGQVYPLSFRLITNALPAVPPGYPVTAPSAAAPNALRTQITAGGGTTTPTIFPVPITGATGTVFEVDNKTPFEDAQLVDYGYGSEVRLARGTYYMSGDCNIWNPSYFCGGNAGKVQSGAVILFRDGFGLMAHNPLTAQQWQPGTQYRLNDRVVPGLRTGAIGSFTLTAINGGATWAVSPTTEPTWNYTSLGTTTDANGHTWTFNRQNQSAVGYVVEYFALRWQGKTIPANRFFCPDDLRNCPRNLVSNGGQPTAWLVGTSYPTGSYTIPTRANATGKYYKATSGGTASGAEPVWPRVNGAVVTSGGITWTCIDYITQQGAGFLTTTVGHGKSVAIDGAPGTGFVLEGNSFSMGGNTNNSKYEAFDIRNCKGHHHVAQGADGETSKFTSFIYGVHVADGGSCSFQDNSNYGNVLELALCDGGARYQNQPWLANAQMHAILLACYCEGSTGGDTDWNGGRLVIGGNHGAGFRAGSNPTWQAVTGVAGPVYPVNSPILEADLAADWSRIRLAHGIDRAQFGSGSVAAGSMIDEQTGGITADAESTLWLWGGLNAVERVDHYGPRGVGRTFLKPFRMGATFSTATLFGSVTTIPTQGLYRAGDRLQWASDNRREAIVFDRVGSIGSLGAWIANHTYANGQIITQSGKDFVAVLPTGVSAVSLSGGFASAATGGYVSDGTQLWRCWQNTQDPQMRAVPNDNATPVAVTDAAHLVGGTGGLDPALGPVLALATPTANRAADVLVTGALVGDKIKFLVPSAAFTWTLNNTGGGGGSFVCPINTPATLSLRFDGTNWAFDSFRPAEILPKFAPVRSFSGTTDIVLAADAQGDVESTGGSAVTVTVPTMPAGFVVTYAQQGTGALSFTASGVTIETAIATGGATTASYQARTLFWRDPTHVRIS